MDESERRQQAELCAEVPSEDEYRQQGCNCAREIERFPGGCQVLVWRLSHCDLRIGCSFR